MLPPRFALSCTPAAFAGLFALLNALLFQWPLLRYAGSHGPGGIVFLLAAVQAVLAFLLMALLVLISRRLAKLAAALLLLGNAAALYFMNTYGVLLDRAMMGNVFATDLAESRELLHPALALYLIGLGLAPAALLWRCRIRPGGRRRLAAGACAALLALTAGLYAASSTWLWLDQHAKRLGGLALPWSYLANSLRHLSHQAQASTVQRLLPDAAWPEAMAEKEVVVLVIGEAARAANIAHYGYARDTNPYTRDSSLIALPGARACATYTTAALTCLLSHLGNAAGLPVNHEPLPSYLSRHGADVIWRSNNNGEPRLAINDYQKRAQAAAGCADCTGHDEDLLHGLAERIQSSSAARVFAVLHLAGSHGPAYHGKYPAAFERHTPVCRSVQPQACTPEALRNAYDNSLIYTDYVLARLIRTLDTLPYPVALIYVADHGESLGEYGLYLHGTPNALAPDVQRDIPFYLWLSDAHPRLRPPPRAPSGLSHGHVFHSTLGAFGMASPVYQPALDLFAGQAP
ncbi:arylsulfatase [Bordetella hinzii 5132]|uniref:phosphoethanolamine--lipid A transferase EptA n=1 Tax=Bordetella hinzii TaxID=103855 RepID=UPI0004596071|nr:phosphoethanolamine--lipid A transferase EptA [Bordetella hinzii]KCB41936.1 arylsulfatase [Bordetella hinzii 5132]